MSKNRRCMFHGEYFTTNKGTSISNSKIIHFEHTCRVVTHNNAKCFMYTCLKIPSTAPT